MTSDREPDSSPRTDGVQPGGSARGGDAHAPTAVGQRFDLAVDIVETAGFRPGRDRFDFWRR